jgi:hypothetical protein
MDVLFIYIHPSVTSDPSPSIIRMIKSRRMRWAGYVARMWKRNLYRILVGKPEGKRSLGRSNIGGWIILKWI